MKTPDKKYDIFDLIVIRYNEEIDFLLMFFEFCMKQNINFRSFVAEKISQKIKSVEKIKDYNKYLISIAKKHFEKINQGEYNYPEIEKSFDQFFADKKTDDFFEFLDFVSIFQSPHKYRRSLGHLVTIQLNTFIENYICDYLRQLFREKKELLNNKSDESKITYDEVLKVDSYKSLLDKIIEMEVDKISHLSIPKISEHLKKRFSIELRKFDNYKEIEDLSKKRDELVHSYISFVRDELKSYSNYQDNESLINKGSIYYQIDDKYVEKSIYATKKFIVEFDKKIKKKMKIS